MNTNKTKRAQTDTRFFRTIALTADFRVKQFFGFNHHNRALNWLAAH
jgi:hypothetical protein